ncbi:Crp/Fnr family transcriptional regulator [Mucilaginibacter auburnensis]|uniref:CRP-like cAMP-binding protein n=1 Tax=Mucilaginibacter auburnensis TaxID=1457233 RepID=A0A2H9VQ33_9SPHI|nr:Crp/Fnr family transcriptional regulator [Mucilaginibacter auburnensis]PJJ80400.1 CRP-like cAMP-binding protein [Mucilaginibacter auburnensis]
MTEAKLYQPLFDYIINRSALQLNDAERALITDAFKPRSFKKREYLLRVNEVCKYMSFITAGAGRMYSINADGQENIVRFAIEQWWLGDYESYNLQQPSIYNIDVLEDTEALTVTHAAMQTLMQKVPAVEAMVKEIDRKSAIATQKRIHSAISLNAAQRYQTLMETYPEFLQRFPQAMIASYLGLSPETLSRVRKQVLRNK